MFGPPQSREPESPIYALLVAQRGNNLRPFLHLFRMSALLEVKNLAYTKGNGQPVISGISFSVNEGDVVVLRGVSGAG